MAIALVADRGSTSDNTDATTTLVDLAAGASITVGNYLLLRVAVDNSGASGALPGLTVTDAASNTWTVTTGALQDPGAADAGVGGYIAYCKVVNAYANGDDVTLTWGVSTIASAPIVEEWSGIHATTPVAVTAVQANGQSSTPSVDITPTASGQLVYGLLAVEQGVGLSYTEDADTTDGTWVALTSVVGGGAGAAGVTSFGGYKLVTGTTAQTWNPTIGAARDWAQNIIVFDAAAGGTDGTATPGVIAVVSTLPAPTLAAGAAPTPAAISAPVTIPAVSATGGGSATATPAAVAATSTLPAPTLAAGATPTPAVIAATSTLPAPTTAAGAAGSPAAASVVATVPAATPAAGALVSVAAIAASSVIPAVTPAAGTVVSPGVIVVTIALPAASATGPATPDDNPIRVTVREVQAIVVREPDTSPTYRETAAITYRESSR